MTRAATIRRIGTVRSTVLAEDTPRLRRKSDDLHGEHRVALARPGCCSGPAPSEAPHTSPLTEIGRTRNAPICTAIVVHANGAITNALDNDRALAILNHNLRATDFDSLNELQRRNAIEALLKSATAIRLSGKLADNEIKQLRAYAEASNDPERKAELKTFTDAAGRCHLPADQGRGGIRPRRHNHSGRGEAKAARDIATANDPVPDRLKPSGAYNPRDILPGNPDSYNEVMKSIAGDLTDRSQAIVGDESIAADHSIAATSGC